METIQSLNGDNERLELVRVTGLTIMRPLYGEEIESMLLDLSDVFKNYPEVEVRNPFDTRPHRIPALRLIKGSDVRDRFDYSNVTRQMLLRDILLDTPGLRRPIESVPILGVQEMPTQEGVERYVAIDLDAKPESQIHKERCQIQKTVDNLSEDDVEDYLIWPNHNAEATLVFLNRQASQKLAKFTLKLVNKILPDTTNLAKYKEYHGKRT